MHRRFRSLIACAALVAVAAAAEPAMAGLDFANSATAVGAVSSSAVTFNGATAAAFGTQNLPSGFAAPGTDRILIAAPTANPIIPQTAALDFNYNFAGPGGQGFQYSFANGDGDYDLVIQMGSVNVGAGGAIVLQQVQFSEFGSPLFSLGFGINQVLTAADANGLLLIDIPEINIPADQRDLVDVVRITFSFTGVGTSFGINAVANPEPGTLALFGVGALGLVGLVRRRRRAAAAKAQSPSA